MEQDRDKLGIHFRDNALQSLYAISSLLQSPFSLIRDNCKQLFPFIFSARLLFFWNNICQKERRSPIHDAVLDPYMYTSPSPLGEYLL